MIESSKLNVFRVIIFIVFILLCISSIVGVVSLIQFLLNPNDFPDFTIYNALYVEAMCILFSVILYKVYSVIRSLKNNPFTEKNVKSFKTIYRCMMTITILDAVFTYNIPKDHGFIVLGTKWGSLDPNCIVYFILAAIALVLSYIFEKAVEIKNENDLTV